MGTSGLALKRLASLLVRKRIECTFVNGDAAFDHCVLRLSSVRLPSVVAFLEYENKGMEFRVAGLILRDASFMPQKEDYPLEWQKTLKLEGAREDDPDKISEWVERELFKSAI